MRKTLMEGENILEAFGDVVQLERAVVALRSVRPNYSREFILLKASEKVKTIVAGADLVRGWSITAARGEKLPFEEDA